MCNNKCEAIECLPLDAQIAYATLQTPDHHLCHQPTYSYSLLQEMQPNEHRLPLHVVYLLGLSS